jgi:hypothetical protein
VNGANLIYPQIEFPIVRRNRVFYDWINVPRRVPILKVQENIVMVLLEFIGIVIGARRAFALNNNCIESLQRTFQVLYDNRTTCVSDLGLISKARSKLINSRLRME